MPTKTDRILSYLPGTFRRAPQRSALFALVDAYGSELLQAENTLAAIMQAHWVDHADRGAEVIDDLARMAALYGLAPRCPKPAADNAGQEKLCSLPSVCDETVEEFRRHLKRYIRTFLDGTVTVQGILRVVAEALGLEIADDYAAMTAWWQRPSDELVTQVANPADAAPLLFGAATVDAQGSAARAAQVQGTVDLSQGVNLGETAILRLRIDDQSPVEVDLVAGVADPTAVSLHWIVVAINVALGAQVARHDGRYLTLASPTPGPNSRLEVQEVAGDAAERLLGLPAHSYAGSAAFAAQLRGTQDLSGGVDLSNERYLRLQIDNTTVAEIDCAGPAPGHTTLDQIVAAINNALGDTVASHDGRFLELTSPTTGAASMVSLQQAAAQDARVRLFGAASMVALGQDDQPARAVSRRDLGRGVDLSQRSVLRISVDGGTALTIDCAGENPANTTLSEIAAAINAAFQTTIARHDGRFLSLTSPTAGPAGAIVFETGMPGDATGDIFGIVPRTFTGAAATAAQIRGVLVLNSGVNLTAQYQLLVALDGAEPVTIDLRSGVMDPTDVQLGDLVTAINTALSQDVTTPEDDHLLLTSPTTGAASHLTILPLTTTVRRRFVTRAPVISEAAAVIFGANTGQAQGTAALPARLEGTATLSRGVDLRTQRYLRLAIDGQPGVDIDCAGKRPHVTVLAEIVDKINTALGMVVATDTGANLVLTSPSAGAQSRIKVEPPQAEDALARLLSVAPGTVRGADGTRVVFAGTVDLSDGADLPAGAAIRIGLDGIEPVLIPLAGTEPTHKTLNALMIAINLALGSNVASHDGAHLLLTSAQTGAASQLVFAPAGEHDVAAAIFGVSPPRSYRGRAATPAEIVGQVELGGENDLSRNRFLRLGVNGAPLVDIDCADPADPAHTSLETIVTAINTATTQPVALAEEGRLTLRAPTSGFASQLTLAPYTSGDARSLLLGNVPDETSGQAPGPATLTGEVDLLAPVNLAERSVIRLAVDGGRPLDIDVAGAVPGQTFGAEIVAAVNQILPGAAALTPEGHLHLTSPTVGENSQLALLPLRYLELIEYPPRPVELPPRPVRHGDHWYVTNSGAGDVFAEVEIQAPHGVVGPGLVNIFSGWQIRLLTTLTAGASARLWRDAERGLRVAILAPNEPIQWLSDDKILVSSLNDSSRPAAAPSTAHERSLVLQLPQGRSQWRYLDCHSSRFDQANFDKGYFVGDVCRERGIFNVSRFVQDRQAPLLPVFAATPPIGDPPVHIVFRWTHHEAGAFRVNLPVDLPPRFGGRFNTARFGLPANTPEVYTDTVTGPADDERYLLSLIAANEHSLVKATIADSVELGWSAIAMPLRKAQFLTLGNETRPARLYLGETGVDGFILLEAREAGAWGNAIAVSTRQSGPGRYDVCILFQGDRFEGARQIALGDPLPALTQDLVQPSAVGILQAKAAGVRAEVSRQDS
ncbi:MAG: hypothetical protein DCC55_03150 [Chloroflexi bacterium]|nr:MAG: hypothetical protein DCC55_03150 [Chloroflexota bacterium]